MKVRIIWAIFAVIQVLGLVLPLFANVHMRIWPLVVGFVLLLPGSILFIVGRNSSLWMCCAVVIINGSLCYLVVRFGDKEFLKG